jgi:acyl transferase domain-containing protein
VRVLRVSHAFHCPLVEPMLARLAEVAAGLSFADPVIPVASGLTGQLAGEGQLTDPAYWAAQARQPVRFAACARSLAGAGAWTFLELGPDGALSALGPDSTPAREGTDPVWVPALRAGQPEDAAMLAAVAPRWTGPRPCPATVGGRGGWTCRRTRSSGGGTGRVLRRVAAGMCPWPGWPPRDIRCWGR